jgi:hypothetical protein
LNLRPPGPKPGALTRLRYAPSTAMWAAVAAFSPGRLYYLIPFRMAAQTGAVTAQPQPPHAEPADAIVVVAPAAMDRPAEIKRRDCERRGSRPRLIRRPQIAVNRPLRAANRRPRRGGCEATGSLATFGPEFAPFPSWTCSEPCSSSRRPLAAMLAQHLAFVPEREAHDRPPA